MNKLVATHIIKEENASFFSLSNLIERIIDLWSANQSTLPQSASRLYDSEEIPSLETIYHCANHFVKRVEEFAKPNIGCHESASLYAAVQQSITKYTYISKPVKWSTPDNSTQTFCSIDTLRSQDIIADNPKRIYQPVLSKKVNRNILEKYELTSIQILDKEFSVIDPEMTESTENHEIDFMATVDSGLVVASGLQFSEHVIAAHLFPYSFSSSSMGMDDEDDDEVLLIEKVKDEKAKVPIGPVAMKRTNLYRF